MSSSIELPQSLLNPLATASQYFSFLQSITNNISSSNDTDQIENEDPTTRLVLIAAALQVTGTVLDLDQETISTALVLFYRAVVLQPQLQPQGLGDGKKVKEKGNWAEWAVAALFIACKNSTRTAKTIGLAPTTLLAVFNELVYTDVEEDHNLVLLGLKPSRPLNGDTKTTERKQAGTGTGADKAPKVQRVTVPQLYEAEMEVLAAQAFETRVVLPYSLALSYVQVLHLNTSTTTTTASNAGDTTGEDGSLEARNETFGQAVWTILNDALVVTAPGLAVVHQPHTIAGAAVYLAAARLGVQIGGIVPIQKQAGEGAEGKKGEDEEGEGGQVQRWWEVFDVDSEEVGHCMVMIVDGMERFKRLRERAKKEPGLVRRLLSCQ